MRLILGILIFTLGQSANAKYSLKFEKNQTFRHILAAYSSLAMTGAIKMKPAYAHMVPGHRMDLITKDFVDKVAQITVKKWPGYYRQLRSSWSNEIAVSFLKWYQTLLEICEHDRRFAKYVQRKTSLQLYDSNGLAIKKKWQFRPRRGKGRRRYNKIQKRIYRKLIWNRLRPKIAKTFYTDGFTAVKMERLKRRDIKIANSSAADEFAGNLMLQETTRGPSHHRSPSYIVWPTGATPFKVDSEPTANPLGKNTFDYRVARDLFHTFYGVSYADAMTYYLEAKTELKLPRYKGIPAPTWSFFYKHKAKILETLGHFTNEFLINQGDITQIQKLRRWIKRNVEVIKTKVPSATELKVGKLPRRKYALKLFPALLKAFPKHPWAKRPIILNHNGNHKYPGRKNVLKYLTRIGTTLGSLTRIEQLVGIGAGIGILALTGGNLWISSATVPIIKRLVAKLFYDLEWKDAFHDLPSRIAVNMLLSAGFIPGEFARNITIGATGGALQGFITGQDIPSSMLVGAITRAITLQIPYRARYGIVLGDSAGTKIVNSLTEIAITGFKSGLQGMTVAFIEGSDVMAAVFKGAIYGASKAAVNILVLGVSYDPRSLFTEEQIRQDLKLETDFQNTTGTGNYDLNMDLVLSSRWRSGGAWNYLARSSTTFAGAVSLHPDHYPELDVLSHEASHLMQQIQTGVWHFYFFRYISEWLRVGWEAHSLENHRN